MPRVMALSTSRRSPTHSRLLLTACLLSGNDTAGYTSTATTRARVHVPNAALPHAMLTQSRTCLGRYRS